MAESKKKLRAGVIGLGFIARIKHMPGLKALADEVDIIAFCDLEQELCDKWIATHGVEGSYTTNDWHDVINDESIDVVYVLTWNTLHCEMTCAALEAGKHVMCEKPMAVTGADARTMLETSKRTGKLLTIGYQNRFREDSLFIKSAIDEGQLGDIYVGKAHAVRRRGVPTWGVFTDLEKQGGGPLIDIGTHSLDLTLWYMDNYEVDSVTGSVFHKISEMPYGKVGSEFDKDNFTTEDSAFGFIKMKNGASIFLEAAWAINFTKGREGAVTLAGTKGGADIDVEDGDYVATLNHVMGDDIVYTKQGPRTKFFGGGWDPSTGSYAGNLEAKTWIDAINGIGEPLVKPEQAVVVTEVLEAIYQSATNDETVTF